MEKSIKKYTLLLLIILIGIVTNFQIEPYMIEASSTSDNAVSTTKNSGLVPLIWTVAIVGGCIAITLSYVSWRKYKGEQKKKLKKDNIVD